MPENVGRLHRRVRLRHLQDFIPFVKAHFHGHRHGHEATERGHVFHMRADVRSEQLRTAARLRVIAVHRRGHGNKVQVVAVIHHRVDARSRAALDVGLIRQRGFLVSFQRCFVIAGAYINVRGHVHDVSRGGRQFGQPMRAGQRALRRIRGLHRMNVVVNRAQMIRLTPNHRL